MRLIDADALIEEVWHSGLGSRQDCVNLIKEMPTKERPHRQWIPCSERLPEDPDTKRIYASKTYQVTTVDGRTIVLLWRKTESRGKMVMRWEWHDGRIYHGDVLAWKPLSEPYKREGEKE